MYLERHKRLTCKKDLEYADIYSMRISRFDMVHGIQNGLSFPTPFDGLIDSGFRRWKRLEKVWNLDVWELYVGNWPKIS